MDSPWIIHAYPHHLGCLLGLVLLAGFFAGVLAGVAIVWSRWRIVCPDVVAGLR